MKRALLIFFCVTGSGCFPFDETLANRCDGGGLTDCPSPDSGEPTGPDGGPGDDGGVNDDGGTPDGGPDDGGTPDGGAADAGPLTGACKHSWCWEHPGPIGSPSLWSVWGTSDTNLWVGGEGGLVLHFDGTSWTTEPVSETLLSAVVRAGFTTPGGETWFCASNNGPMQLTGEVLSTWPTGASCGSADWWNGDMYFVAEGDGPVVRSPGPSLGPPTSTVSVYDRFSLGAGSNGVLVGGSSSTPLGLFIDWFGPGETDGHRGQLINGADGGTYDFFIRSINRGPDDELWLLAYAPGVNMIGKLTDAGVTLQVLAEPNTSLNDFGYVPDAGWWFIGGNAYTATGSVDPFSLPASSTTYYQSLYAGWQSPQGTLWAVGEGGLVRRNGVAVTPYLQPPVFDLITTEPVTAIGGNPGSTGAILRRGDGGVWTPVLPNPPNTLLAVSRMRDGGLVTFDVTGKTTEGSIPLSNSAEPANAARATLAVDPFDTIWLETPNQLSYWAGDKQQHLLAPSTGLEFSDLTIAHDGGVLFTLRDPGGNEAVGGLATLAADGGLEWIVTGKRLDAVAAWEDGYAAVSANNMQICAPTCFPWTPAPGGSPLSLAAFSSSEMYVMHHNGSIYQFTGPSWLNVSPPVGDFFQAGRLRASADGQALYMVGDNGAILRRSRP